MDPVYKSDLAINLSKNYSQLQKNYIKDSHHHDVCVSIRLNINLKFISPLSLYHLLTCSPPPPLSLSLSGEQYHGPDFHSSLPGEQYACMLT